MNITSEARSFHLCLDVRGALTNWSLKDFRGMFKDDDGRTMTPHEAKAALLEELSQGHNFIPMGGKCDNFDHKEHGCMGHPVPKRNGETA
ncbi:hypothetical protein G3N59_01065 [Paraburkholderia sp. Ac-20340]|uniref:hypothetical protein n=1 Tax=Paraburkholderia sp. Ac-20340 TaxID=2703888 RepID=UPI00197D432E|nr:hypothetical protein [Paraburkholderia sp. Ac-20340]MBN3851957.1 hypothetical protein [Paraburkholderia sp. Ac-20340]